jgi:hypothetical protein
MTYSDHILQLGKKLFKEKFHGVYPSDHIPELTKEKPYAILNLDKSTESGSHWVAIAKVDNEIYIYDPTEITQYVASVILPQTTILATDRIVVYLYGKAYQNNNTLSFNFTNTAVAAKYPMAFGTSISDNFSGTFVFSLNGTCSGTLTSNADGYGTIKLPNNLTLTNVLRVKSVQTLNLSAALITGLPPTQVGTIKQTYYNSIFSNNRKRFFNIRQNIWV